MVVWFYGFMVLWSHGFMVLWFMVLWFYGVVVLWLYGFVELLFSGCMVLWFCWFLVLWSQFTKHLLCFQEDVDPISKILKMLLDGPSWFSVRIFSPTKNTNTDVQHFEIYKHIIFQNVWGLS